MQDSEVADLNKNDFSIQITQARKVVPEPTGGYFSYLSPASAYAVFVIETKSRLPMYESENKVHQVIRRFSDFEYLLKQLTEKPEYKSYMFPSLPEKRILNNLDDAFIEKRRLELEGFLRVLIQSDNRIKNDMNVNAFLTFSEAKFNEFRVNPNPILEKMWGVFNSLPS